jgi:hypothetical protein
MHIYESTPGGIRKGSQNSNRGNLRLVGEHIEDKIGQAILFWLQVDAVHHVKVFF